jgi:NAD-dependent SIR2 family protein deacetylase
MIVDSLNDFIACHPRLFVLTGAGCSTESGIPDYRDADGGWKRKQPVTYQAFMGEDAVRRRYWARSFIGWRRIREAVPNLAHLALAQLESMGRIELLVTQNVDGLHQAAGSRRVLDLHGRLDILRCMNCDSEIGREQWQQRLLADNPDWAELQAQAAPDGDADLEGLDFSRFNVPSCTVCGGIVKPDVVFFGEPVPKQRIERALAALQSADAALVIGSSLMVYSGYRYARAAAEAGKPIAAVTLGRTRADALLSLKLAQSCTQALSFLLDEPELDAERLAAAT